MLYRSSPSRRFLSRRVGSLLQSLGAKCKMAFKPQSRSGESSSAIDVQGKPSTSAKRPQTKWALKDTGWLEQVLPDFMQPYTSDPDYDEVLDFWWKVYKRRMFGEFGTRSKVKPKFAIGDVLKWSGAKGHRVRVTGIQHHGPGDAAPSYHVIYNDARSQYRREQAMNTHTPRPLRGHYSWRVLERTLTR